MRRMIIVDWYNLLNKQGICNGANPFVKFIIFSNIFILLLNGPISSQSNLSNYQIERFSVNEGLPSSEVHGGFQDSLGYLWFTTDRGVARYNGYEFERFTKEDGLMVNSNIQLFPKDQTSFWLVGLNGALTEWNGKYFSPFKWSDEIKEFSNRYGIPKLIKYEASKLIICFGFKDEIWNLNTNTGDFTKLKPDWSLNFPHKYSPNYINDKISDYEINLYKFEQYGFTDNTVLTYRNISSFVLQELTDTLLHHSTTAIIRMNQEGQFIDSIYFGQERIINSLKSIDDQWYVLLNDNILLLNNDPNAKQIISPFLSGNSYADIMTDQFNTIWISTLDNGIIKLKKTEFENLISPNEQTKKVKMMKGLDSALLILSGVHLYVKDWNSDYVELTKTTRLSSLNTKNNEFYFNKQLVKPNGEIVENPITSMTASKNFIEIDSAKYLEFNTYNCVLHHFSSQKILPHPRATAYLILDNKILIGTTDGLYQISIGKDSAFIEAVFEKQIQGDRVKNIITYKNYILVALSQSILLIDKTNSYWLNIPFLHSTIIEKLYADESGELWIGTNIGLIKSKIFLDQNKITLKHEKTFNSAAGLPSSFITGIEKVAGELFIGTSGGLCKYIEEEQTVPFELKITLDSLVSHNGRLKYNKGETLKMKADERDLQVYLDLLSFHQSNKMMPLKFNLFKGDDLITNGNIGGKYVELFSLEKGKYELEIFQEIYKSTDDNTLVIPFSIQPKLYETILFYILLVLLSAGLLYFFWRRERSKLIRKEEKKRSILKLQINALISKMNPHFTFNVLTNIQGFIYKKNFSEAISYISLFSQMMRKSLEYSKLEFIPLQDEIDFLETYLKLEQMRFPEQLNYSIEVDPTLETHKINIPTLIIQTLVENAVKHGVAKVEGKGNILVSFTSKHSFEFLMVKITDDGHGINVRELNKINKGMGLAIVQERIELLKAQYGSDQIYIKIENLNPNAERKGTRIHLCLPATLS